MADGVDFSWARPTPQELIAAGETFVYRYIGVNVGGKSATRPELDEYTNAGLAVILGYEEDGQELLGGWPAGVRIGYAIQAALNDLGYPDAVVFANADFDASPGQQDAINAALDGIASVRGLDKTGLYSGYWVIKRAFDAGKITYAMQTYAWSGGNWDPRAQVQQYQNGQIIAGSDVDFDRAMVANFGQIGGPSLAGLDVSPFNPAAVAAKKVLEADMPVFTDSDLTIYWPNGWYDRYDANVYAALKAYFTNGGQVIDGTLGTVVREVWTATDGVIARTAAAVASGVSQSTSGAPVDIAKLAADILAGMPKTFTVTPAVK
jgi:hypothetical protein